MRLLFVIPHYFQHASQGSAATGLKRRHGSIVATIETRTRAITRTLMSLHQAFGSSQAMIHVADRKMVPANLAVRNEVHIVVVTTGNSHLVNELANSSALFHHAPLDCEPTHLGFHCQDILRDRWGNYDYYSYLEDDLAIDDAWFFEKLRWFNSCVGNESVLLPNRFERGEDLMFKKCYIDGDLARRVTKPFQDVSIAATLKSTVMGKAIRFVRPLNPHSGCYFLNAAQMQTWINQPHFASRECGFIGPLESAATLGIMKTFRIYKPCADDACFLEIEHYDNRFLRLVRMKNP
jgi:hypothetical protein